VVNIQGSAVAAARQNLADQFFQALKRGSANANDPFLVGTVKDAFERVLATELLRSSGATDNLDSLSWDEGGNGLDWQETADARALVGRRGRLNGTVNPATPPATVQHDVTNRAVLDQYFAQAADDTDQATDDD